MHSLFIIEQEPKGNVITLTDLSLLHQITRVLRIRVGDQFRLQKHELSRTIRRKVSLQSMTPKELIVTILQEEVRSRTTDQRVMMIAFPNKHEKLELIVQKLTEIGVTDVVFFPAQRSVLKELSANKQSRVEQIVCEAVEQSWGWHIPRLSYLSSFSFPTMPMVVFDCKETLLSETITHTTPSLCGLIGPEGGFSEQERSLFIEKAIPSVSLGDTVLRMETAAILGAWRIKNYLQ